MNTPEYRRSAGTRQPVLPFAVFLAAGAAAVTFGVALLPCVIILGRR